MKNLVFNKRINWLLAAAIVLIAFTGCKKNNSAPEKPKFVAPAAGDVEKINDLTYIKKVIVGAQSNQDLGGCLNILNGYVWDVEAAGEVQGEIDLVLMNGSSSFMNLISPASQRFSAWGTSVAPRKYIDDRWWNRNLASLICLPEPSIAESDLFDQAQSVVDLLAAFNNIRDTVNRRPGYNKTNDGPASNVRKVSAGSIVLFYSEVRKTVAILKVDSIVEGNDGLMQLQIKSGTF